MDGVVYVSGGDGLLHEFNAITGEPLRANGRVPPSPKGDPVLGRAVVAVPPAIADDLLYVGSGDNRLYAYWRGAP
jgi:outer membrane protein assembly factor BamB